MDIYYRSLWEAEFSPMEYKRAPNSYPTERALAYLARDAIENICGIMEIVPQDGVI